MERYELIWNWDKVFIGKYSLIFMAAMIFLTGVVCGALLGWVT